MKYRYDGRASLGTYFCGECNKETTCGERFSEVLHEDSCNDQEGDSLIYTFGPAEVISIVKWNRSCVGALTRTILEEEFPNLLAEFEEEQKRKVESN